MRELKVLRKPTGNLRSQPTLWHLIRKNTPGCETCFACGESDGRMELHEEWSVADNDDIVLMGLYWLCSFCHGKISEGFRYPKSSLQDLARRDGIGPAFEGRSQHGVVTAPESGVE